jgi:hypothetical protein
MWDYPALLHPLLIPVMSTTIPVLLKKWTTCAGLLVGMLRIQWTAWIGFGGRHGPDYAVALGVGP